MKKFLILGIAVLAGCTEATPPTKPAATPSPTGQTVASASTATPTTAVAPSSSMLVSLDVPNMT